MQRGEAQVVSFAPDGAGHDGGREVRDALDDLRHEDVRPEVGLVSPSLDDMHVGAVVAKRVRAVEAVLTLPGHHVVSPVEVGTHELLVVGLPGVGATREADVVGEETGEDLELALVIVQPPPTDEFTADSLQRRSGIVVTSASLRIPRCRRRSRTRTRRSRGRAPARRSRTARRCASCSVPSAIISLKPGAVRSRAFDHLARRTARARGR